MDKLEGSNGIENIFFMPQLLAYLFSMLIDFFQHISHAPSINAHDSEKVETLLM